MRRLLVIPLLWHVLYVGDVYVTPEYGCFSVSRDEELDKERQAEGRRVMGDLCRALRKELIAEQGDSEVTTP